MEKIYKVKIKLLSQSLPASSAWGTVIDSDIVKDEVGLPYIPGKRIKGILRDAVDEIISLFDSNYDDFLKKFFGYQGMDENTALKVSNFYLVDTFEKLKDLRKGMKYLLSKFGFSEDRITDFFTTYRIQTAIDKDGKTKEHSLRNFRVLKKGLEFYGEIILNYENSHELEIYESFLTLGFKNMRQLGTSRTRGYGLIECSLIGEKMELNKAIEKLKGGEK